MGQSIEILVGDVTDMEARVYARYRKTRGDGDAEIEPIKLRGTLRGPYCDTAHTLPAEFAFREAPDGPADMVEAVVTDPCMWSPDLPHLYHVDIEARLGDQVVAEIHDNIGLRRMAPRWPVDFAPGTG